MTNHTDNELTAGLFCVTQAHGRAHFTSDRKVAHDSAARVRELLRAGGLAGVHQVGVAYLGPDKPVAPVPPGGLTAPDRRAILLVGACRAPRVSYS